MHCVAGHLQELRPVAEGATSCRRASPPRPSSCGEEHGLRRRRPLPVTRAARGCSVLVLDLGLFFCLDLILLDLFNPV